MQAPLLQTYGHFPPEPAQLPVLSHVSGCKPLHRLAPGMQTPVQVPALHTLVQSELLTHAPAALQVCGVLPLHWADPGTQLPVHAPLLQT